MTEPGRFLGYVFMTITGVWFLFFNGLGLFMTFVASCVVALVGGSTPVEPIQASVFTLYDSLTPTNLEEECEKVVMSDSSKNQNFSVMDSKEEYGSKYITVQLNSSFDNEDESQKLECVLNKQDQVLVTNEYDGEKFNNDQQ